MSKPPLIFKIIKKYKKARVSIMTLPHGDVNTYHIYFIIIF
jgi:hypothetical protein